MFIIATYILVCNAECISCYKVLMAHRMLQTQQHVFHYRNFHINKSQPLGHGSYGAVYKAKCDQLPCAAKVLHPTILDPTDPGAGKIMERFQQECAFLESIRHPNIVQYLGITRDPESKLPVLLMELLDESLTKMLERSRQSLAYYVQVDICHDIALAVTYLHSNDIIHRDLSSNNVLMITGRRAKVTDFGMSKLAGAAPSMTPLTMCPGTLVYMPPEALREPPRYTKKLDCFSEGVIMIQVYTRLWPEPGPRTQIVQDSKSLTGIMEMPVPETHRRRNHIDLIDPNHALLPIAVDCLKFQDKDRPSSEELCQRLAGLKENREYRESVQYQYDEVQAKDNQITAQVQQLQERDRLLEQRGSEMNQQLQNKDRLLQQRATENSSLIQELQDKDKTILELQRHIQLLRMNQEELASQERQLRQLNQQLEEQQQDTSEIQGINHSLQRQLQQQLSQQNLKPPQLSSQPPPSSQAQVGGRQLQEESPKQLPVQSSHQEDHNPHSHRVRKMTVNWRDGGKAPLKMSRGVAVVDGNVAYFMNWSGEVCSYNLSSRKWSNLLKCPYQYSSLAVINGRVTTIGGRDDFSRKNAYTNRLLSLPGYKEVFPPMPTKRRSTTAVTSKEHLIVAGGATGILGADRIITVEVMDTKTLVWSILASLPHPHSFASGMICGDQLYMLGGLDDKGAIKSMLTCSLTELLQSSSSSSSSIWHRVADAPAYGSTCAAVNGELLAVGGCDKDLKPTSAVHQYNPTTNSWDLISNMPTARYRNLVAVLPTSEMLVVGGMIDQCYHVIDKAEVANVYLKLVV